MPLDAPVAHSSTSLTLSLVVEESSASVHKALVQETIEEYYYLDKQGKTVLITLSTIYF